MTDDSPHARLIDSLALELRPIRRLHSPWLRAAVWILLFAIAIAVLAGFGDLRGLQHRISMVPDVGWAMLGAGLTAALAAIAAFQSSVPGRAAGWNFLPLPALVLWTASSGLGCFEAAADELGHPASLRSALRECLPFILLTSLPLLAALFVMLRRGYPPSPPQTAALAGLAAAAGAATLLNFFHPFDVAAIDLLVHGLIVAVIVMISGGFGRRVLHG
jgi:hypothetical protein